MRRAKDIKVVIRAGALDGYRSATTVDSDKDEIVITIDPSALGAKPERVQNIQDSLRDLAVMVLVRWLHEKRVK